MPRAPNWADVLGQIKTVNHNGRTLVQFEGTDRGWRGIHLEAPAHHAGPASDGVMWRECTPPTPRQNDADRRDLSRS